MTQPNSPISAFVSKTMKFSVADTSKKMAIDLTTVGTICNCRGMKSTIYNNKKA